MKKICILLTLVMLSACGTLPIKYEAQNYYRVPAGNKPQIDVGKFTYVPFVKGDLAANQIHNTALGRIYVSTPLADFAKRATALELEKSGFSLANAADKRVEGDVLQFTADDLGYSVDWKYRITYRIVSTTSQSKLFEKTFESDPLTTGKFGLAQDFSPSANEVVLSTYEKFVRDPEAISILLSNTN